MRDVKLGMCCRGGVVNPPAATAVPLSAADTAAGSVADSMLGTLDTIVEGSRVGKLPLVVGTGSVLD